MKLIDLLVQELPKRGGWPDGAIECCRHYGTNSIDFYDETGNWDDDCYLKYGKDFAKDCIYEETSESHHLQSISRSEYESALAASQKPAWNGEGLPPVGCECVVTPHNTAWGFSSVDDYTGRVLAYDGEDFWFVMLGGVKVTSRTDKVDFRPIKSEADKKRDAAINNILTIIDCNGVDPKNSAIQIYDAIAAGKIPGVKLEY